MTIPSDLVRHHLRSPFHQAADATRMSRNGHDNLKCGACQPFGDGSQILEGMDAKKVQHRCEEMGFRVERQQPYRTHDIALDPEVPQHSVRIYRKSVSYGQFSSKK
jgi:hypothetical protein